MRLEDTIRKLTFRMRQTLPALRDWDHEDLVQEAFLRTFAALSGFRGESSLKTWVVGMVRRILINEARHLSYKPQASDQTEAMPALTEDQDQRDELRCRTKGLLRWLRDNPDGIDQGWAVLNLLLKTHGDFNYTTVALTLHTGQPWTVERVRNVVRAIKATPRGRVLCEALGVADNASGSEE